MEDSDSPVAESPPGAAASSRTWEAASSPQALELVREFETAWRSNATTRPAPSDYWIRAADDRDGARLAILRAEMGLRWESGDLATAAGFFARYPDLDDESRVALIYEEFCLREECGEAPNPNAYLAQYPNHAARLARVLDIHALVGSGRTVTLVRNADGSTTRFPESGQTIAGFHLVEELGRGTFARVFLARERQLADRPVALKVTRAGSAEPETLARLQHTHIVPIHSYRTDPATGLHLLCMPYFGRVTLSHLLSAPRSSGPRSGKDLLAALEQLGTDSEPLLGGRKDATARREIERRSYAHAIAWWGARLAEALQHAHDRGVLHRDLKPSNVLVTADAMPMLLDFNLAQTTLSAGAADRPAGMGGTLAYMAPEHLEALAANEPAAIDARSDVYSLGVVLFEAMGSRPFAQPSPAPNLTEALRQLARERRMGAVRLRRVHPETPPAFECVVAKCLAGEPELRYQTAGQLAADLQAIADDGPLITASEPLASRSVRWTRRNARRLLIAAPIALALVAILVSVVNGRLEKVRRRGDIQNQLGEGRHAQELGDYELAGAHFRTAQELARNDSEFDPLRRDARNRERHAQEAASLQLAANSLFDAADSLRFHFLGFGGDLAEDSRLLTERLRPFYVLNHLNWTGRPELLDLTPATRRRLVREVEELLFLWSNALIRTKQLAALELAKSVTQKAQAFCQREAPWLELRAIARAAEDGLAPTLAGIPIPAEESNPWVCFQWARVLKLIEDLGGRLPPGLRRSWLDRTVRLDPSNYWHQYEIANDYRAARRDDLAYAHYEAAIALQSQAPWAYCDLGWIDVRRGTLGRARENLERSIDLARRRGTPFPEASLNLGIVLHKLGDFAGARAAYATVIDQSSEDPTVDAARLNVAALDVESGDFERAASTYKELLEHDPHDSQARLGRAMLELRRGNPMGAENELDAILSETPARADALTLRALTRLRRGEFDGAAHDARNAFRLDPTPAHDRLRTRALLAKSADRELRLDDPRDVWLLPGDRSALESDLARAATRLADSAELNDRLSLAVILACLGRAKQADDAASWAVGVEPQSTRAFLIRSRVRHWFGRTLDALNDVDRGLAIDSGDPGLLETKAAVLLDAGRAAEALAALNKAALRGGPSRIHSTNAIILASAGRFEDARAEWTARLQRDPDDAGAFLGRARCLRQLRQWDQALADLENAAGLAANDPLMTTKIAIESARLIPARPKRAWRSLVLLNRALQAARSDKQSELALPLPAD